MISLKKFKKFKEIMEKKISKKSFRGRFLYEAIYDEKFADELLDFEDKFNGKFSAQELNDIFTKIREKTIENYNQIKKDNDLQSKVNHSLRSLAYYYYLECLDEYSSLSDIIIEEIKNKYPNNYLQMIANADKKYLSADMKDKINPNIKIDNNDDDSIKKYLVLKKWQDRQHYFFEGDYWKDIEKVHLDYVKDSKFTPYELEQEALKKRLFDDLKKNKLLDLDTCSILSELYIKKEVVKLIGGKMYGLAVLNSKRIPVPYTLVIPTDTDINEKDLKNLDKKYESFSIRSSADIEDGNKHSFAGMFDSYLDIKKTNIIDNVKKVKDSVNNNRVKEYIKLNGLGEPHMAVIIQAFKEPTYAGVWIGNSEDSGILEYVNGNGEKLVSGTNTPISEKWKEGNPCENPFIVENVQIGRKMLEYQKEVGCNSDFEWMILDNKLVMLQFRPVTRTISQIEEVEKNKKAIYGTPASSGIVSGKAQLLLSPEEKLEEGNILLTKITGISWVPNLMKAKGAVTARGGFLCHTAIICRELGIPCVTGIGDDALKKVSEMKNIKIDGNVGKIEKIIIQFNKHVKT